MINSQLVVGGLIECCTITFHPEIPSGLLHHPFLEHVIQCLYPAAVHCSSEGCLISLEMFINSSKVNVLQLLLKPYVYVLNDLCSFIGLHELSSLVASISLNSSVLTTASWGKASLFSHAFPLGSYQHILLPPKYAQWHKTRLMKWRLGCEVFVSSDCLWFVSRRTSFSCYWVWGHLRPNRFKQRCHIYVSLSSHPAVSVSDLW